MRKISNEFYQGELTLTTILVIFEDMASKLEKIGPIFSSFNPFPSLPSVATDGRKQFQVVFPLSVHGHKEDVGDVLLLFG